MLIEDDGDDVAQVHCINKMITDSLKSLGLHIQCIIIIVIIIKWFVLQVKTFTK
jgi:hypothetical protein